MFMAKDIRNVFHKIGLQTHYILKYDGDSLDGVNAKRMHFDASEHHLFDSEEDWYINGFTKVKGGSYADTLIGDSTNDSFWGSSGNDSIEGRGGDDNLYGDNGSDFLHGGGGNDTLEGGSDNDTLIRSRAKAATICFTASAATTRSMAAMARTCSTAVLGRTPWPAGLVTIPTMWIPLAIRSLSGKARATT